MVFWSLVALASLPGAGEAPVTAALDLRGLPEGAWTSLDALGLEKRVLLRLVQEGFAVVAPDQGPQVRLEALLQGDHLRLVAFSPAGLCAERWIATANASPSELHLEAAHKAIELVRACRPAPSTKSPKPERAQGVGPYTLAGGVGALARAGGVDPELSGSVRYGHHLGWLLAGSWSFGGAQGLAVHEARLSLGVAQRLYTSARLELEGAVVAGAQLHLFIASGPLPPGLGLRVDPRLVVPLTASFLLTPRFGLRLTVEGSFTLRGREHLEDGRVWWSRGPWGAGAAVGLFIRP